MQVYAGFLLAQGVYHTYYIATRDHYGTALVDMITTDSLLWPKQRAVVVTKLEDFTDTCYLQEG